jgi:DNA-binding NarL/FixJ family response regulator
MTHFPSGARLGITPTILRVDASPEKVRVVVQDALPLVRIGLQRIFEDDPEVSLLAVVDEPHELPAACGASGADVAIFQLNADSPERIAEMVPACRSARPGLRLIGMHLGRRGDHAEQARALGIDLLSYASKPADIAAAAKQASLSPEIDLTDDATDGRRRARPLTAGEVEVLRLAAKGVPCSVAASQLGLEVTEVLRRAEEARTLLGADSLRTAVQRGRQAGLVPSSRLGH